jgi:hypothetical protein
MLKANSFHAPASEDAARPVRLPPDDESVHQWYRIIMGFDWKLVQYVIDVLSIGPNHIVLDPFSLRQVNSLLSLTPDHSAGWGGRIRNFAFRMIVSNSRDFAEGA